MLVSPCHWPISAAAIRANSRLASPSRIAPCTAGNSSGCSLQCPSRDASLLDFLCGGNPPDIPVRSGCPLTDPEPHLDRGLLLGLPMREWCLPFVAYSLPLSGRSKFNCNIEVCRNERVCYRVNKIIGAIRPACNPPSIALFLRCSRCCSGETSLRYKMEAYSNHHSPRVPRSVPRSFHTELLKLYKIKVTNSRNNKKPNRDPVTPKTAAPDRGPTGHLFSQVPYYTFFCVQSSSQNEKKNKNKTNKNKKNNSVLKRAQ